MFPLYWLPTLSNDGNSPAVLVLPHRNAHEERVFSLIRKNKTTFRPFLQMDDTLASLLTIKTANKKSSFEPPEDWLVSAKKATWNYNKEHQSDSM